MIDNYIKFIKNNKSHINKSVPSIIISGLPTINEQTTYCKVNDNYKGVAKKILEVNSLYANIAKKTI